MSTLRIEIEAPVPYEKSRLWSLHRDYYQQQGLEAFLRQEVPYNISSNPCLAQQTVRLLLASLPDGYPERLAVIEIGAGSGIFAYNFLQALESLAPDLLTRVDYWLSDYSQASLHALANHPAFAAWADRGVLRFCQVDGERPSEAFDWQGQPLELPETGFQLILANYFFSTLPTAVLLKQAPDWHQQVTKLDWQPLGPDPQPEQIQAFCRAVATQLRSYRLLDHVASDHPQYAMFSALQQAQESVAEQLETRLPPDEDFGVWLEEELAKAWARHLGRANGDHLLATVSSLLGDPLFKRAGYPPEQLAETHSFEQVATSELFASDLHRQVVEALTADWPQASVGYSARALDSLGTMVKLTCPGGLVLISDKAYAEAGWMRGIHPESATRHGQSLAHPVNFPLFEAVMGQQGISTCRTRDTAQALHSLMVYCGSELPEAIAQSFSRDFIDYPRNEISHALLEGGHALMQAERLEQAGRSLQRALNYRPGDGTLQYLHAVCLLNQERYGEAITQLEQPHDDIFGLFNREILQAESWRLAGHPAKALAYYLASLRHGENSQTYYNLALCQIELGQHKAARQSLSLAAGLDPDDLEIQLLLAELPAGNGTGPD